MKKPTIRSASPHRYRPMLLGIVVATTLYGCGRKTLPNELAGTFKRPGIEGHGFNQKTSVKELIITTNGLSQETNSASVTKVKCDSETSCRFEGQGGRIAGTISKQPNGDIVLTCEGFCDWWAGKWMTEENAKTELAKLETEVAKRNADEKKKFDEIKAAADARKASAGSGSNGSGNTGCLAQCTADAIQCQQECKKDDVGCNAQCSATAVKCSDGCPK